MQLHIHTLEKQAVIYRHQLYESKTLQQSSNQPAKRNKNQFLRDLYYISKDVFYSSSLELSLQKTVEWDDEKNKCCRLDYWYVWKNDTYKVSVLRLLFLHWL